jgi:hypothetical protein
MVRVLTFGFTSSVTGSFAVGIRSKADDYRCACRAGQATESRTGASATDQCLAWLQGWTCRCAVSICPALRTDTEVSPSPSFTYYHSESGKKIAAAGAELPWSLHEWSGRVGDDATIVRRRRAMMCLPSSSANLSDAAPPIRSGRCGLYPNRC